MKKPLLIAFSLFVVLLCLAPLFANILGYTAVNRENRPLARKPKLVDNSGINLEFPKDFDDYWADHFGIREELVTAVNTASLAIFNDALSEKTIPGKDGFLFFSETLGDYTGLNALSEDDILRCATVIRLVGEYAKGTGANFVFSVAPNKNTVYPEFMPDHIIKSRLLSNRERLYTALFDMGVDTIDFSSLLKENKPQGLLYYQQDTHWNQRGALLAYNAIMGRIMGNGQGDLGYNTYSDAKSVEKSGYFGDLHNFVLPCEESALTFPDYGINQEYALDDGARPQRDVSFGTTSDINKAKSLLLYRDSFGEAIIPLLSANLGRAVYSQGFPYDATLCDEGFDLVMIELVERNIPNLLTGLPLVPATKKALEPNAKEIAFTHTQGERGDYISHYITPKETVAATSRVFIALDGENAFAYEAMPTYVEDKLVYGITLPTDESLAVTNVYVID